jgi:curli biogenesis system outer membrane secretion channel CsgG
MGYNFSMVLRKNPKIIFHSQILRVKIVYTIIMDRGLVMKACYRRVARGALVVCMAVFFAGLSGCATTFLITDKMAQPIIDGQIDQIEAALEPNAPVAVWWCDDERFQKSNTLDMSTAGEAQSVYTISTIAYWIQYYIESELVQSGNYRVVSRTKLEAIFKEQKFQTSNDIDDDTVVSLGKILGAQFMIIPTITPNSTLNIRVLDVETSQILYLSDTKFKENQRVGA